MESDVRKPSEDTKPDPKWNKLEGKDNIWISEEGTFYEGTSTLETDHPLNVVIEIITLEKVKPSHQKELSELETKTKKEVVEVETEQDDKTSDSGNNTDETDDNIPEIYSCNICYEEFNDEKDLQHHNLSHLVVQPQTFSCDHCDKTFVRKEQLQRHQVLKSHLATSDKEKEKDELTCSICSTRFHNKVLLNKHKSTHKEIFQCTVCSKEFAQLKSLKTHQRIH